MTSRAPIHVLLYLAVATAALAQSRPNHLQPHSVTIQPTTQAPESTSLEIGSDHWSARGYDLKSLLSEVYALDPRRIEIPETPITTARYDVSFALSDDATPEEIQHIIQQALHDKFKVTITPESRPFDVYVITAPKGPGPALHPHSPRASDDQDGIERFDYKARVCPGISSGGITASAGSIAEFRRTLEPTLDRLILNESNLPGMFDFQIGEYRSKEELFDLLRKQLGLILTPARRSVTVLTIHPA